MATTSRLTIWLSLGAVAVAATLGMALAPDPAHAQSAKVVQSCSIQTYTVGEAKSVTMLPNGDLCSHAANAVTGSVGAPQSAPINLTTPGTLAIIAPPPAGQSIHITHWDVTASAPDTLILEGGSGGACGTGTVALTGTYTFGGLGGGISAGSGGNSTIIQVPAGSGVCALTTGTVKDGGSDVV